MKDLNVIFGGFGTGKTYEIAARVKTVAQRLAKERSKGVFNRVYVLVPDQYTLAVERLYMSYLGEELMVYVRVYSFKRFCRVALKECGNVSDVNLSDVGRNILALRAVESVSSGFRHYPKGYKNVGFTGLLCEIFRDLKGRGVAPEYLYEIGKSADNSKITDIALAYGAYEGLFSEDCFDPDDLHLAAAKAIEENGLFCGCEIFVDQFKTLNAKERGVISALLSADASVTVSMLSSSGKADFDDPMWGVEKNGRLLISKVKKSGGNVVFARKDEPCRYKTEDVAYLAANVFSDSSEPFEKKPENVSVYCASDLTDEAEYVASEISKLVRGGLKYSDIAVTARDIDAYSGVIDPVFSEYKIPVFYHKKTPVRQKSPMTFILSVISVCTDGYGRENVLSAFKTGFLDAEPDAVSLLENYFFKWPYSAKDLSRPFVKSPSGFVTERQSAEDAAEDARILSVINNLREYFVEAVSRFSAVGKRNTVRNYAKALYDVMTFVKMPEKIESTADLYRDFSEHSLYAEQLRVYDMIIKMLDETVAVCGDLEISVSDFRSVFISAAEKTDIAILPTSLDRVVAGTVAMLPFLSPKVVFVMGCADGVFPREAEGDALFTEAELELLEENDIELGKTLDEKVNYEKFLFLLAVSAASEKCFTSYPIKGLGTGSASEYISRIKRLFSNLEERLSPSVTAFCGAEDRIVNAETAFSLYSKTASADLAAFLENTEFKPFLYGKEEKEPSLSAKNAEGLFGKNVYLSPSNTKSYAVCPYSFFIEYGLKIKPERRAEINAAEFGNIIHKGLETLLDVAEKEPEKLTEHVRAFEEEELKLLFGGDEPSESFRVHFNNVMKKLERTLSRLAEENRRSDFEIYACEKRVGRGPEDVPSVVLPLKDGGSVTMGGIADRIDVYHGTQKDYFRILDYKTGDQIFSRENIGKGIDMQLLMYLCAVVESVENAAPAGVSYVKVNPRPIEVSRSDTDAQRAAKTRKDEYSGSRGITLNEKEVISALDTNNAHSSSPELYGTETTSEADFEKLFDSVKGTLVSFGERIKTGDIKKTVVEFKKKSGKQNSCHYCNYRDFCDMARTEGETNA